MLPAIRGPADSGCGEETSRWRQSWFVKCPGPAGQRCIQIGGAAFFFLSSTVQRSLRGPDGTEGVFLPLELSGLYCTAR
ncbi:uncharacterized protein PgNI_11575 [Pyricularia grisea]|uniref:Uncharacterized protein n=1 Tax=Pyricularia grisea TaxID=148305 RepID=A0A6P8ANT7_PYRGI|nr:uncharacterized protein PgNI_11575 [Pyricularia grisea]TLD03693.1 hypothetical protein PgNI_11575 [Pyricularia grisea]